MNLKDPLLLKNKAYIGGAWPAAESGRTMEVINPSTGSRIGTVPRMDAADAERAVQEAHTAFDPWRNKTARERADLLRKWYELIVAHQDDLAAIITTEQGKPYKEAIGEAQYGATFVEWFAEEACRVYGDVIPPVNPGERIVVVKEPVGVVAAITPWNFPLAMITRKCAPAIAVGCTVVIKPAEDTPLTALALAELAHRAGIPAGVLNVITGDPRAIGPVLTSHPLVRKLTFTGSTDTGKLLMKQCSGTVKKVSLELGGNAPFIVFDDADLDEAVKGLMQSKFRNTGQTCVCANRVYVQGGVYDRFAEKLKNAVAAMKVGDGFEDKVDLGPLINDEALAKVESHIGDAVAKGAKVLTGGRPHPRGGTFYEPTILVDVTGTMLLSREETFGPVAPLFRFDSEEEVVAMANDTEFGLAAYCYTRDLGRAWRVSGALEFGIVGINRGMVSYAVAPFGGMKESGIGREGSKYGIEEFLEVKYLCMGW